MGSCGVIVIVTALASVSAIWRDPTVVVELTVHANRTTFNVGDVTQFTCTAHHMPMVTATLYFGHQRGDREHRLIPGGRSELVRTHVVTAHDAGSALACDSGYTDRDEAGKTYSYTVRATPLPLAVSGVTATTPPPPTAASLSISMSTNASSSTQRAGDYVQFTCQATNMQYVFLEVRQAKGNLESALHVGNQQTRIVTYQLTAADHGTNLFCQAWLTDHSGHAYHLNSNRIPINIH